MTAIRIPAQFIQVLDYLGADGVEMNISDQFPKVGILLAQYRLESILKKMSISLMGSIEPESITG
jgi:hypothetical protein